MSGLALGHAAGEVPRRDGVGGPRHLAQRPQAAPYDDQGQHAHRQQHGQAGEQLHLAQRVERVVGRVEREGGDQGPLGDGDGNGAVLAVGIALAAQDHGIGVGAEGAAVTPDADVPVDVGHLLGRDVPGQDGRRVRVGGRPRGTTQDHPPLAVEEDQVHVCGHPAREVRGRDRQVASRGEAQVVEAERLVLGQGVVGLAVEIGADRGIGHDVGDEQAGHQQQRHDGDESSLEAHPSRGRRSV